MAPIPIKPLADIAIKYGPKAGKLIIDNAGKIGVAYNAAQGAKKVVGENKKNRIEEGKIHYRKERYIEFNKTIIKKLDELERADLYNYKLEVKQFIHQINMEMRQEIKAKKPLHNKRRKNWESLFVQINDKIKMKDYQEYLKIYNNCEYDSTYFEGFETNIKKFKELIEIANNDEITRFLVGQTGVDPNVIRNDFL